MLGVEYIGSMSDEPNTEVPDEESQEQLPQTQTSQVVVQRITHHPRTQVTTGPLEERRRRALSKALLAQHQASVLMAMAPHPLTASVQAAPYHSYTPHPVHSSGVSPNALWMNAALALQQQQHYQQQQQQQQQHMMTMQVPDQIPSRVPPPLAARLHGPPVVQNPALSTFAAISQNLQMSILQRRMELEKMERESAARSTSSGSISSTERGELGSAARPPSLEPAATTTRDSSTGTRSGTARATSNVPVSEAGSSVSPQQSRSPQHETETQQEQSLVHESCRLYPTSKAVVSSALRVDPSGVRRRVPTAADFSTRRATATQEITKKKRLIYDFPINLALANNASLDVLQRLVQAGPDVILQPDGPSGGGSLHVALSKKYSVEVIQLLIQANPNCIQKKDRRSNLPLHVACSVGSPLSIIKLLCTYYPAAMAQEDFNGQTPLDIAQRSTMCSDAVIDCLQQSAFDFLENEAIHLDTGSADEDAS